MGWSGPSSDLFSGSRRPEEWEDFHALRTDTGHTRYQTINVSQVFHEETGLDNPSFPPSQLRKHLRSSETTGSPWICSLGSFWIRSFISPRFEVSSWLLVLVRVLGPRQDSRERRQSQSTMKMGHGPALVFRSLRTALVLVGPVWRTPGCTCGLGVASAQRSRCVRGNSTLLQ